METSEEFDKSIFRHNVSGKVTKCRPEDELVGEFEFAFIDGAHDYESVCRDIEKVSAVLAPGGLIAFHDYRGGIDPGVDKAVDELLASGGQMISLTKTLAVVKPPALIPQEA
jgi:predicted O-methyltransferase YrrM